MSRGAGPNRTQPAAERAKARGTAIGSALQAVPLVPEFRIRKPGQPLTDRWSRLPVEAPDQTLLGISFRPLQAVALGLDPRQALTELLSYPYPLLRLAAYWKELELESGDLAAGALDDQIDAAAAAGKQIILCVGAIKAFGYPEFFVPAHHLPQPLPEGQLVGPHTHPRLLEGACAFLTNIVERYRDRAEIVAWQVEHEPVDPLGMEHSWRLAAAFVEQELAAVRAADPSRPVILTGFLPMSSPVRWQQRWRTRDQGDSLALAGQTADIVGLNIYPTHALLRLGPRTAYLAGSQTPRQLRANTLTCTRLGRSGRRLMVTEGQAEPWETVTTPPSPPGQGMYSCLPEQVIDTYNQALRLIRDAGAQPWAYLFWGAEYWLKRRDQGDDRYLAAFGRILAQRPPN